MEVPPTEGTTLGIKKAGSKSVNRDKRKPVCFRPPSLHPRKIEGQNHDKIPKGSGPVLGNRPVRAGENSIGKGTPLRKCDGTREKEGRTQE